MSLKISTVLLKKRIFFVKFIDSVDNIRSRFMSRFSEIMSSNFENIGVEESENEIMRSTKKNSASRTQKQKSLKTNLRDHSEYSKNDSNNSNMMRVKTLNKFKKTVNHETNEIL